MSGGELSEGSLHSGKNSPWHYHRAETAQVSDTLREGRGREERVGKALHDINNCMLCTSVPTGLCVMPFHAGVSAWGLFLEHLAQSNMQRGNDKKAIWYIDSLSGFQPQILHVNSLVTQTL